MIVGIPTVYQISSFGGYNEGIVEIKLSLLLYMPVASLTKIYSFLLAPLSALDGIDAVLEEYRDLIMTLLINGKYQGCGDFLKKVMPDSLDEQIDAIIQEYSSWKYEQAISSFAQLALMTINEYEYLKTIEVGDTFPRYELEDWTSGHRYRLFEKHLGVEERSITIFTGKQIFMYLYFVVEELWSDPSINGKFNPSLYPNSVSKNLNTPFSSTQICLVTARDTSYLDISIGGFDAFWNHLNPHTFYIQGGFTPSMLFTINNVQNPEGFEHYWMYLEPSISVSDDGSITTFYHTYWTPELALMCETGSGMRVYDDSAYWNQNSNDYIEGGDYYTHRRAYFRARIVWIRQFYQPTEMPIETKGIQPILPALIADAFTNEEACDPGNALCWIDASLVYGEDELVYGES